MVRVIGHRGASASHPENTIEAFVAASEVGAQGIELDVRRTSDDVLVVFHDAHLTSGEMLRELTAAELPPWIPSLAEALEACADTWVNVEIKNMPDDPDYDSEHGLSVAVAGLIAAFEAFERVIVSSFNIRSVDRIRSLEPSIPTAWLVWGGGDPGSFIDRTVAHDLTAIHPHEHLIDAGFVKRAHAAGLLVNAWTVDDLDRVRQLVDFGVDGIITNTPGEVVEALRA